MDPEAPPCRYCRRRPALLAHYRDTGELVRLCRWCLESLRMHGAVSEGRPPRGAFR